MLSYSPQLSLEGKQQGEARHILYQIGACAGALPVLTFGQLECPQQLLHAWIISSPELPDFLLQTLFALCRRSPTICSPLSHPILLDSFPSLCHLGHFSFELTRCVSHIVLLATLHWLYWKRLQERNILPQHMSQWGSVLGGVLINGNIEE